MLFFSKRLLIFCLPFIVITFIYIATDPFMIIYDYENFNKNYYIHKNRDYVSTEMFLKNRGKYKYDSFIFGSSTSLFTPPSIWEDYINNSGLIYSFDASGENIVGIWSKIKYLSDHNHNIRNALIVIDRSMFSQFINDNPIFMKHYEVYPSSRIYFQYKYFLNFWDIKFMIALTHHKLSGKFYPYMRHVFELEPYYYNEITNEYYNVGILNELKTDSLKYYETRLDKFPSRTGNYLESDPLVSHEQIEMIQNIKDIFSKKETDYRLIICPSYDQIAFNRDDLKVLQNIFGKDYVFDFSGINEISEQKSNFFDGLHFKKYVAKELFDVAYQPNNINTYNQTKNEIHSY